jgi:hypothetical protein
MRPPSKRRNGEEASVVTLTVVSDPIGCHSGARAQRGDPGNHNHGPGVMGSGLSSLRSRSRVFPTSPHHNWPKPETSDLGEPRNDPRMEPVLEPRHEDV